MIDDCAAVEIVWNTGESSLSLVLETSLEDTSMRITESTIWCCIFNNDEYQVISAVCLTLLAAIWDANKGIRTRKLVDHSGIVNSCSIARVSALLFCCHSYFSLLPSSDVRPPGHFPVGAIWPPLHSSNRCTHLVYFPFESYRIIIKYSQVVAMTVQPSCGISAARSSCRAYITTIRSQQCAWLLTATHCIQGDWTALSGNGT